MLSRHVFGDDWVDFSQAAERAGLCFVDVLASGCCWPGNALQACSWVFGDGLGDFFLVSADQAGPCFVDVLASGWRWLGNILQACFWGWFVRLFPGVG